MKDSRWFGMPRDGRQAIPKTVDNNKKLPAVPANSSQSSQIMRCLTSAPR